MRARRLAVIGTGLMGASVALAARRAGVESTVGFDPAPEALAAAVERGAVEAASSTADAVDGADLAVVAAPVTRLPAVVEEVLAASGDGCTVTDLGSTKQAVCAAAGASARFVGGHPVAGSEARGAAHAREDIFEGATWFLTPLASTDTDRYRLVHGFVGELGATP